MTLTVSPCRCLCEESLHICDIGSEVLLVDGHVEIPWDEASRQPFFDMFPLFVTEIPNDSHNKQQQDTIHININIDIKNLLFTYIYIYRSIKYVLFKDLHLETTDI